MRRLLVLSSVLYAAAGAAVSQGERLVNVSGPAFLRGIGPREPRVDEPLAAAVTAVAVAFVIYRGLRVHDNKKVIIGLGDVTARSKDIVRAVRRRLPTGD